MSVDDLLDGEPLPSDGHQTLRWFLAGTATACVGWCAGALAGMAWVGRRIDVPVRIRLKR